jgi:hypothetical protein
VVVGQDLLSGRARCSAPTNSLLKGCEKDIGRGGAILPNPPPMRSPRILRAGGIHIVATHHHLTTEGPRYIFLHYRGLGDAPGLAMKLKAAIDTQAK